ncbi:MAG: ribokinase [Rhizobiales bacterium]|nr:ribokinase [Hyphomicrobiales bacterium]
MIVVFGSINLDLVTEVAAIPRPGETVLGPGYAKIPGGKGANQALAARRAGARVALVGATGRDDFAEAALALLAADDVDLTGVARVEAPTGAAFIAVDARGENAIVVASGANAFARADGLAAVPLGPNDTLLLQRETPDAENLAAARRAKAAGARVVLNLAPAGALSEAWLRTLDVLVLNEHEAAALGAATGVGSAPDAVARAIDARHGVACVVTLGAEGAIAWTGGVRREAPAPTIEVVDTTGAGDAFVGAFAAALDHGLHIGGALLRGVAAGGLACTRHGAQTSLPRAPEIEALALKIGAADLIRG